MESIDKNIGDKVLFYLDRYGIKNKAEFCRSIPIDPSLFGRLTKGKARWNSETIEKVVKGFKRFDADVSAADLFGKEIEIPVIAHVSAGEAFQWSDGGYQAGCGFDFIKASEVPGIDPIQAKNYYAVRVRGESMLPLFKDGDTLVVKPGSHEEIRNGDKVIFKDSDYNAYVKWIEFRNGDIILNSFNAIYKPMHYQKKDMLMMDKIVVILTS